MEMNGSRMIAADRETVWKHLNSAETLQACIPGCQELEGSPEEGFQATVVQKVGPVKATFKGEVTLQDVNAPESYKLVGEGKGGVAGFAKGGAVVKLTEVEGGTELSYDVEAKVGGKLAQLGNRIVNGFAKKMVDAFFERFEAVVEGRDPNAVKEAAEG
ncbi:CoxG family protein [uncultured Maritimibacter sp.]|jgi:carbon monoxide dehydrogenase subunit G|uniref:CoxG family protein n=1 Tax=uncultured Maritimibacter sp. TaxID=991866 RepID=UPI000B11E008|nr:carbon monoxide dehydrogenase subunit G [uncultured Maritimibacter sp.]